MLKLPNWLIGYPVIEVRPELQQAEIAIVIGHHTMAKGFFSPHFGMAEWDFNKILTENLNSNVDVYFHSPNILGYTARQKSTAKQISKKKYKLVIELHFNASGHPSANGVECFHYFLNKKTKGYAKQYCQVMQEEHGLTNRGAKALYNSRQNGYGFVYHQKADAILAELNFGSNLSDCQKVKSAEHAAMSLDIFIKSI